MVRQDHQRIYLDTVWKFAIVVNFLEKEQINVKSVDAL